MSSDELKEKINEGMSTYELADFFNKGQTTIRYWLRKYGLNTNLSKSSLLRNSRKCICCNEPLIGRQLKYCSKKCKGHKCNPNNYLAQQKRAVKRKKELLRLAGNCCQKCGYANNLAALVFHHRDPNNKVFTLDMRKLSNTNWDSILMEFKKCDLLCSNCHMEEHYPEHQIE